MTCPRCKQDNPPQAKFCLECATPLARPRCARCSADAPGDARFCPQCGNALDPPNETSPRVAATGRPPVAPDAERRRLTVMFCDLVGSTALSGRLDPEELRQVVRRYQAACADVIRRFDGYIAQYLGDGLLVYFGYPAAHEDDAKRAVATGLGIVDAVASLGLGVRIGIHTGPVVIGEVGDEARSERLALGETPNLAARLESAAEPDTVMISEATYRLVRDGFACQDLGPRIFKGVDTPVPVYRVLEGAPVRSRAGPAPARPVTGLSREASA
jgi:class 3 adenylate cyclase